MFDLKNNMKGLNSTWIGIHFNTLLQIYDRERTK